MLVLNIGGKVSKLKKTTLSINTSIFLAALLHNINIFYKSNGILGASEKNVGEKKCTNEINRQSVMRQSWPPKSKKFTAVRQISIMVTEA